MHSRRIVVGRVRRPRLGNTRSRKRSFKGLFTPNRSVSVPYPYRPFSFSALDLHNTVPCPIRIRCPRPFSAVRIILINNMTGSSESLEDLAVLALLLILYDNEPFL
jgi:hypothetical protein